MLDNLERGHREAVPPGARSSSRTCGTARRSTRRSRTASTACCTSRRLRSSASRSATPSATTGPTSAGTLNLLEAMVAAGVPRLVFSSTVRGLRPARRGADRRDRRRPGPSNAYGASKLAVDLMIRRLLPRHGLGAVSLRYFNVAGASGDLGEDHEPETHLIPNVLRAALGVAARRRGLRNRLPDARRHRGPRLHPHRGSRRRAPARARRRARVRAPDLQPRQRQRVLGPRGDRRGRAPSRGSRSRVARRRDAPATRRCWSPPASGSAPSSAGSARKPGLERDGRRRLGVRPGAPDGYSE